MAYNKTTWVDGETLIDAEKLNNIESAVEALDLALDAKVVEVEKTYHSTNRFNKDKMPFIRGIYASNTFPSTGKINVAQGVNGGYEAGSGWVNIPIEAGKTYTMAINDPVTLTDMDNIVYGVFTNLWFTDVDGLIICTVPFAGKGYYGNDETNYDTSKVICKGYTAAGMNGMQTSAIQVQVIDERISYITIQIGSVAFNNFQINTNFATTRGHLTDAEVEQLQNSFQINEGTELLEYEAGDYNYTVIENHSNLTKLASAFEEEIIPSSNLLNPVDFVYNHRYIANGSFMLDGSILMYGYPNSALLIIPVKKGTYVLYSNEEMSIGNSTFGYFGEPTFTDEAGIVISSTYRFDASLGVTSDTNKVIVSGATTTKLTFKILDDSIQKVYIPLLDSKFNPFGLWTTYSPTTGLTDEEIYQLVYQMQLNKDRLIDWKAFDDITSKIVVTPEHISGLEDFQSNMETKINESLAKMASEDSTMECIIEDNNIWIKAKHYTDSLDFIWQTAKQGGGNQYFNISAAYLLASSVEGMDTSMLGSWKGCGDDCCPVQFNGTYIAANHGYNCVDKLTVTAHGKTEADIGSVWLDSNSKTYVLTHIYDENTIGVIMFNDTNMGNGIMGYGSPSGTMTHSSGATNTSDIVIESRTSTQLWKCHNNYSIKLLVDSQEQDLDTNATIVGNRVEVITQYNVIYVPAMLTYLMSNVGNNTINSQNSDDITDYYFTVYVKYQFNRNGSISTYSSFYINKNITVNGLGLVQSQAISSTPYTYVPDTTFENLTLNDGTEHSFSTSTWKSADKPPYRYFQFADENANKGIVLAYDRTVGWGENSKRLSHLNKGGDYNASTKKMYPAFISGCSLATGTFFDGLAVRVPLQKIDEDITSVGWYWCSDDIILMIDTHNAVNKDIVLPDYMNNMRVEVLDKTDSVTCEQTYIFNNKLRFIASGYGYLVARLYK